MGIPVRWPARIPLRLPAALPAGLLPRVVIGAVAILLAPLIWIALEEPAPADPGGSGGSGGSGSSSAPAAAFAGDDTGRGTPRRSGEDSFAALVGAEPVPDEEIGALLARIERDDARALLEGFDERSLRRWSPRVFPLVLEAFARRGESAPAPALLELEAMVITAAVERDIDLEDPGQRLRSLRSRAITLGGEALFAAISRDLLRVPEIGEWLAQRDLAAPGEVIASAALLGDPDLAARWAMPILFPPGRDLPSIEPSAEWARALAELAGASNDGRLLDALARYVEPIELERRPGASAGVSRRVAQWLGGVERLAAVEAGRRGGTDIAAAIELLSAAVSPGADRAEEPLPARLRRRVTLDLSRARIVAARVRERSSAPLSEDQAARERQLFRIGVAALLLDDRAELGQVLDRLSRHDEESEATFYRELLAAGRARLDGSAAAAQRIGKLLGRDAESADGSRRLYPAEVEDFRRLAERGWLVAAVDRPAVRFESAKAWAELGEGARPWLDRSLGLLRGEISSKRDLGYLHFLESRIALADGRVEGIAPRLLGLLDEGPPPGLSRQEIAVLLVVLDEREDDLASAGELRAEALSTLAPLVEDSAYDPVPEECAQALRLVIALESEAVRPAIEEGFEEGLDALEARFLRPGGLPFELESARRVLREALFSASRREQRSGELEVARALLARVRRLAGGSVELLVAEGELERALAGATPEDRPAEAAEHHLAAGRAFRAAAHLEPPGTERHLDAARAFLAAGALDEARRSLEEYAPQVTHGERDDGPAWDAVLLLVEIERRAGRPRAVIDLADARILDRDATYPVLETLLLEKAGALESLGSDGPALEIYDRLLHDLEPSSALWRRAVVRRAGVLERRIAGLDPARAAPEIRAARDAWAEAASWLHPSDGTADAAVARHHAAEHSLSLGETAVARRHIEALFAGEDAFRAASPPPEERRRFDGAAEKALYALGDAWRMERDARRAEDAYQEAIERYPSSPRVPYGYLMLGEIVRERGDRAAALGLYRRGERKAEAFAGELAREVPVDLRDELRSRIRQLEAGQ